MPANFTLTVNTSFPTNYIWWVTIIIATIIVMILSELATYFLHDMREIKVEHT